MRSLDADATSIEAALSVTKLTELALVERAGRQVRINPDYALRTCGYGETVASLPHMLKPARTVRDRVAAAV